MSNVNCTACRREGPALEEAPFRDSLGREILENVCQTCWKNWLEFQVKLINEYSLLPVNPEHGAVLERNLKVFLSLPSRTDDDLAKVGIPPSE